MDPCPEGRAGTPYGARCCDTDTPVHYWSEHRHKGVDIVASTGTPVLAAWGGTVTGLSWGSAFGTQLVIDQDPLPDGTPGLWAVYAHLSATRVGTGARVAPGDPIGAVGATGNVSGPHLHYEVRTAASYQAGRDRDPGPWLHAADTTTPPAEDDLTPEQDQLLRDVYNFCFAYRQRGDVGPAALGMWLEDTRIIIGQVSDAVNRVEALLRDNS